MDILEIKDLVVGIENKIILNGVNLVLQEDENYILFGPNGSGKTTLINAVMGMQPYKVLSGKILFKGEDITEKTVYDRARL